MGVHIAEPRGLPSSHEEQRLPRLPGSSSWSSAVEHARAILIHPVTMQMATVFVAYFIAGKLGQATTNIRSGNIGPVWPAYGIALAALLAYGIRVWPAVLASAFVVALQSPVFVSTALGQAAGATLAAAVGTWLLRRMVGFDPALPRLRDALAFIVVGAFGSAVVSASIGSFALYATQLQAYSGLGSAWLIYWLGDATGVLLVTPLVFTAGTLFRGHSRTRRIELAALLIVLTCACFLTFGDVVLVPIRLITLAAVLPFVMWAAINFGIGGAAVSMFLIATIATFLAAMGLGPFSVNTPFVNAVLLDVLFMVLAVSGLALAAVIAERERAEAEREKVIRAQTAIEARLRLAAIVESLNEAVLSVTLDGVIQSWNAAAQRIFGFTEAEAIGRQTTMLIPAGLWDRDPTILKRLTTGERIPPYETVCVTSTDKKLPVSVTISPLRNSEDQVIGAATILRDITEEKEAEAALSSVSRRLIDAQEQERSRIARDLHDDIAQRLAVLAINLTGLSDKDELHYQAAEIAADVQALSHRLHSSRMQLLGLTATIRHYCAEFAAQQKALVNFVAHDIPRQLPPDISLCLLRIVQEALHNAAKHSGAREFEVKLWRARGHAHLTVSDRGRGFDVEFARRRAQGIGLMSMDERIKLVHGTLSIESEPGCGTTIHALVPTSEISAAPS